MTNQQDEYNKSYALTRGNATHNELHNPNAMAEFQRTGSFGGTQNYASGSAPTLPSGGAGTSRKARQTGGRQTGAGQKSSGDPRMVWTLGGAGLALWGAFEWDVASRFEPDQAWIGYAIAAAVGGAIGYKLFAHRGLVVTVALIAAVVYFWEDIKPFLNGQ
jgi:hypothetical protein